MKSIGKTRASAQKPKPRATVAQTAPTNAMKNFVGILAIALILLTTMPRYSSAQVQGKDFGFGIILGEPLGGTIKAWFNSQNALVVDVGASYFGSPRIQLDYLWHFDAFNSNIVKLYAGPGLALGIGNGNGGWWYRNHEGDVFFVRENGGVGFGARAIIGMNIIPRNTPIELFLEVGPLIGLSPSFGSAFDAGLGIRFYP